MDRRHFLQLGSTAFAAMAIGCNRAAREFDYNALTLAGLAALLWDDGHVQASTSARIVTATPSERRLFGTVGQGSLYANLQSPYALIVMEAQLDNVFLRGNVRAEEQILFSLDMHRSYRGIEEVRITNNNLPLLHYADRLTLREDENLMMATIRSGQNVVPGHSTYEVQPDKKRLRIQNPYATDILISIEEPESNISRIV